MNLLVKKTFLFLIFGMAFVQAFCWNTPTYSSPGNGSSQWTGVGLNWNAVTGSDVYQLEVDTSANFNSPALILVQENYINSSSSNNDTYEFLEDLFFGKTYHWRVRAWVVGDTSAWSAPRTFTTRDYVDLDSPNNSASVWTGVGLDWDAHWGIDVYQLEVDTTPNFNSGALVTHSESYTNTSSSNNDTYEFLTDLYFGKTYYWRVRAINLVDTSGWGNVRTFNTRDFVDLDSPNNGSSVWTGVGLDWDAHWGVDVYQLEVDTTPNFNSGALVTHSESYTNTSSSNNDTYEFLEDLYFGKTYYWRVRAINLVDTSGWGTVRTFNTRDYVDLDSPNNGSSTWTGVGLDWDAHWGVDLYQLEVDTTPNFNSGALITHAESYTNTSSSNSDTYEFLTDLYFGKTYYWRVRAVNGVDTSGWSTVWTLNTRDYVNLDSPNNGSSTWTGVGFDWDAHWGVDLYQLEVDTTLNFNSGALLTHAETYSNTSSSNTDTYEFFTDLYFGKTYYWRVRAVNAVDTSEWSTVWTINTRDYVILDSPNNGSSTWTGVGFDWDTHWGVDLYEFELDTTNNFNSGALITHSENYISSSSSNTDTYEYFSDLYFGKTYYWRVRAVNAVDTSEWSSVWTINTRDYVTLDGPNNGSNTWTGVGFDWDAHWGADVYQFEADTTPNFNSTARVTHSENYISSSSSNTDTYEFIDDLYFGETYYWRVRAVNAVDTSEWSTIWTLNTRDYVTLDAPTNGATNQNTSGVGLNWDAHWGIDVYQLEWDTTNLFNSGALQTHSENYLSSSSSNTDTYENSGGLLPNQVYFWRVRAINAVDTSAWTSWVFSTGSLIITPDIPTLVSPSNGASGVGVSTTLDWNPANNATHYEYTYSTSASFVGAAMFMTSATSASVSGLNPNTRYYWKVRSRNGGFYSDWSTVWNFETGTNCTVTALFSASATAVCLNETITFTNSSSGASSYNWQIDGTGFSTATNAQYTFPNSGTYSISLIADAGAGCLDTVSQSIQVNALPTVIANATAQTLCLGESITLTGSGASMYNWDQNVTDGIAFTPLATQTYTVTGTDANSCMNTAQVTVTLNEVDTAVTSTSGTLTATSAGATGYQWLDCNQGNAPISGATGINFTPTVSGNYAVEVLENGCTDTSGCFFVSVTGQAEPLNAQSIRVFPNPFQDQLTIELGTVSSKVTLEVVDLEGKVLMRFTDSQTQTVQLSLAHLSPGMYFVRIEDQGQLTTSKIVKL